MMLYTITGTVSYLINSVRTGFLVPLSEVNATNKCHFYTWGHGNIGIIKDETGAEIPIQETENLTLVYHKEDGPANIYEYDKDNYVCHDWYFNGLFHRYDGPAIYELSEHDGEYEEWHIHGNEIDEKEYLTWVEEHDMDINNLSMNDKLLIDLKWG